MNITMRDLVRATVSACMAAALLLPAWNGYAQPKPDKVSAIQREAITLYRAGKYEQAARRYQELVRLQPNNVDTLKDLMWVLRRAERWEEMATVATQIVARWQDDIQAWNALGEAKVAMGMKPEAIKAFEKSLHVDPRQLQLWRLVAQLYLDLREYAQAEELVREALTRNPQATEFYPLLARAQSFQEDFAEAAKTWAKAKAAFPDQLAYAYQEAAALYHSGQTDQAQATLKVLVAKHPEYQPAVNLLVDQAIVQRDWASAARLLERQLAEPIPADAPQLLKLARLYRQLGRMDAYLATLDRCLQASPTYGEALVMKAEHFKKTGQFAPAAKLYQQLLEENPWSLQALNGLADVHYSRGRYGQAVRLMERARRLDPTDPYLLLSQARYLYAHGEFNASKQLVTRWLNTNRGPVLFALVYHGLVESSDDPLLASPVHMTVDTFEDQIRALHDAGFTPVTAEQVRQWSQGTAELPERPVLITFDDARLDSFRHADPILARYGFHATMFVPLVNIERSLPGYASWEQLAQYHQTGRWEIQSHGVDAARHILLDPEGRQGLFLVNRQWLDEPQRLETVEEWRHRIAADYERANRTIAEHLGSAPVAFAYPESNFGQEGIPNVKEAARVNLELVRRTYGSAYHQDRYGLNVRSEHPTRLTRLTPPQSWTGADLVRHITHKNPFVLANLTLLRQAAWKGRIREARDRLDRLRQAGVSKSLLLVEQARLHFAAGDPIHGRALVEQALQKDRTPETVQIAESLRAGDARWVWAPSVWFYQDNRDREHLVADQSFGSWQVGSSLWRLRHRSGLFRESGIDDVTGHGIGLETTANLGLFHQVNVEAMGHLFDGEAGETFTASAALDSRWLDSLSTKLEVGHAPVETARALNADVQDRYLGGGVTWNGGGSWQASLRGRAADRSDDNRRYTAVAEIARRLTELLPSSQLISRLTVDDTEAVSPHYYSPRQLLLYQVGMQYDALLGKVFGLSIRYLPGYGDEQGSAPRFVHTLDVEAPVKWRGRPWLRPVFSMTRTPTFHSNRVGLKLEVRF